MYRTFEPNTTEIIWGVAIAIAVFVIVILILFGFSFFVKKIKQDIEFVKEKMINIRSEVIISVEDKMVYKKIVNNKKGVTTESVTLDDFIYSLSINPESKNFRELLKLIENGSTKVQLGKKLKSIEDNKILVTLKYSETRASIAVIEMDAENKEYDKFIKFQLSESFFSFKKKESFRDILRDEVKFLNEHKMFQAVTKSVKGLKTKGWTVLKIENAYETIPTWKDNLINTMQLIKIKFLLKEEGIESFLSNERALYCIVTSGRNSNPISIYRNWNNKIGLLLSASKQYYFDISSSEVTVTTANDFVKDSRAINTTLMAVDMLSRLSASDKVNKKVIDDINAKTLKIHEDASALLKEAKESKLPIIATEFELKQKTPKGIVEFSLDLPVEDIDVILKNSYQHKRELILLSIKEAMKKSNKYKTKLNTIMFDIKNASIIASLVQNIEPKDNFYISFAQDETRYTVEQLNGWFRSMRHKGHKLIQLIRTLDDGSTKIHIAMKPEYILYTKDFSKVEDKEEKININLSKLNTIKKKNVKILNIK